MRIGLSVKTNYQVEDPRQGAEWVLERVQAAREAGLESLFVGDHHSTAQAYYQNTVMLARALPEWGKATVGALFLVPLWHPVLLAEQVGTLASLHPGRFVIQAALGPADHQFPAMGVDPRHRPSRFEEALEIVRELLAGSEVTVDGKRFKISGARISPLPPEPVAIWIAAIAPPAIQRAGRMGEGWVGSPALTLEESRRDLEIYREACAEHGRGVGRAVLRRDLYVGETAEEASAMAREVVKKGYRGFPKESLLIGTAEQIGHRLSEFSAVGFDEVLIRNLASDQERSIQSIRRMAEVRSVVDQLC